LRRTLRKEGKPSGIVAKYDGPIICGVYTAFHICRIVTDFY
jgi:hypothetical protein